MINTLPRLWRTLRHLRVAQIYGRVLFQWTSPGVDERSAPRMRALCHLPWCQPVMRDPCMLGPDTFVFLDKVGKLEEHGWDDLALDKLWRYNLHYFNDLTGKDADIRASWHHALLTRWVRENPPANGTGWDPFPTSLRIVNWIKWTFAGNELSAGQMHSLAVQARWLFGRLERHLLGNHLLTNAKALIFAGVFFEGEEATQWLAVGSRIVQTEIEEQILSDGGQFERSTMYHALALEDVLDLCNLAARVRKLGLRDVEKVGVACAKRVGAMRHWLSVMSHPDGEIAFFNDAAFGIAPTPAMLDGYSERLGFAPPAPLNFGLTNLAASGYVRIANADAVLLCDVAPVGPDYLPAHAHADTLSFELSLFGRRLIVNSGTSLYGTGSERLRQRGTAAHNTVVLDEQDSTEVWSGFRVGRRARPVNVLTGGASEAVVEASHDGYRFLPGSPSHRRRWTLNSDALTVTDTISGSFRRATARLHLHPDVECLGVLNGSDTVILGSRDGRQVRVRVKGGTLQVEAASWHPRFGACRQTMCIVVHFAGSTLLTRLEWGSSA